MDKLFYYGEDSNSVESIELTSKQIKMFKEVQEMFDKVKTKDFKSMEETAKKVADKFPECHDVTYGLENIDIDMWFSIGKEEEAMFPLWSETSNAFSFDINNFNLSLQGDHSVKNSCGFGVSKDDTSWYTTRMYFLKSKGSDVDRPPLDSIMVRHILTPPEKELLMKVKDLVDADLEESDLILQLEKLEKNNDIKVLVDGNSIDFITTINDTRIFWPLKNPKTNEVVFDPGNVVTGEIWGKNHVSDDLWYEKEEEWWNNKKSNTLPPIKEL